MLWHILGLIFLIALFGTIYMATSGKLTYIDDGE